MSTPSDPFSTPPAGPPAWQASPTSSGPAGATQPFATTPGAWGSSPLAPSGPSSTSGRAIIALCCALGSFLLVPLVLAVVALALVPGARREIDSSGGRLTGDGLLTATKVLAWVNIALCVLGVLALVLLFGSFFLFGFT